MTMNETELSRLLRTRARPDGRRGWRCPDEARLAAWTEHRLADKDADRVERHLAECATCLEQVAFLARFEPSAETSADPRLRARAENLVSERRAAWRAPVVRWASVTAVAACAVLAVMVYVHQPTGATTPAGSRGGRSPAPAPAGQASMPTPAAALPLKSVSPTTAGSPEPKPAPPSRKAVRKSAAAPSGSELVSPRDGAMLPAQAPEFRWKAVAGSLFYEIHVVTEDGSVVWQANVDETSTRLPAGHALRAGEKYFVWVRAHLSGGGTVRSAAISFHLGS